MTEIVPNMEYGPIRQALNVVLRVASVMGLDGEDDTSPEVREKMLNVLGLTPADITGLSDVLDGKMTASGQAVAAHLDDYFGTGDWRPQTPAGWIMAVGKIGTTYGYRLRAQGAFTPTSITEGRTVDALVGVSPNIVRFRIDDGEGVDAPVPGVDAVNLTLRDLAGNSIDALLLWDEDASHYQAISASAYSWLAAREGAIVSVSGLNEPYGVSVLTIMGTVPASMTVGNTYTFSIDGLGGRPPYAYTLLGAWPTGLAIGGETGNGNGSPTADGSYPGLSVRVTDADGSTADLDEFTITVTAATALEISGTPVTSATQGAAYAGFTVTAVGGQAPYTLSLRGTWPSNMSVNSAGQVTGTPGNSGSFANLSVRVTDALGATDDLDDFTLDVAAATEGLVGYAASSGSDPTIPAHQIGDWIIALGVRTGNHGGVAPSVTIDVDNPWEQWDVLVEGTDRAAAVYKMKAISAAHTVTWANAAGYRPVWVYRGMEPDVLKIAGFTNSTSITFPEL